jgi:hypothetical protein
MLALVGMLTIGALACSSTPTGNNPPGDTGGGDTGGGDTGGGDGGGGDGGGGGGDTGPPTLSGDVQPILTNSCAFSGCHAGTSPQEGMNLSAGLTHSNTVNVASNQSGLDRIEPGLANQSYLVHKIQGTQGTVAGSGLRMPRGGTPLSQANIDIIRAWIADGAQNN